MSAIYVLLEELEIVKAESRAEISHHLTDCSRIIPSRTLKSKDKEKRVLCIDAFYS
jgi:hypothetical protein